MSEVLVSRSEARRRFWRRLFSDIRALAAPIIAYWGMLLLSTTLFTALIAINEGGSEPELLWIVAGLWAVTTSGVLFGQICALTRIRSFVVWLLGVAIVGMLFAVAIGLEMQANERQQDLALLTGILSIFVVLFPFFAVSGLLSLRTSVFSVFALFAPFVWMTSSILYVAEEVTGAASRWFAGDKWAIWDIATAPILLIGIALSVLYLASRERHRIYRWTTGTGAADTASVRRIRGSAAGATMSGCGTMVVLALLAVVLTVGTGLLSPYLWRSEQRPEGEPSEQPSPTPASKDNGGVPDKQHNDSTDPNGEGSGQTEGAGDPGASEGGQRVIEAARQASISLFFLLLIVLLTLLGLLVFGPPLRRSFLLQSLRDPIVSPSPSKRVADAWRLCEVALGDLGVARAPGDTPRALVDKAVAKLPPALNLESLAEAAEIATRARYGLGLEPQDEEHARRHAEMAYQSVWDALGEWDKVRAIYRWNL